MRDQEDVIATEDAGFTIGDLARQTGVSAETIRYYEREGVVPAAARGGAGRYRQYTKADAERLRFIRHARDLGFSLGEVGELLELAAGDPGRSCDDVNRIARAHLEQVALKISKLSALKSELERTIGECAGTVPVSECRILKALR